MVQEYKFIPEIIIDINTSKMTLVFIRLFLFAFNYRMEPQVTNNHPLVC